MTLYTKIIARGGIPSILLKLFIAGSFLISGNLTAQTEEADEDIVELEEFVIEGILAGQARSLKSEREASSLTAVISSDKIGRLPDANAAESVQRLVGMSTEVDQGEGRYVVIRGIDPDLNNVKIDGALIAAPEADGRGVSLDVVPSDVISEIEVVKAVTPDMDGDAIGGSVNIKTSSAFDTEGMTLRGSFKYGFNELDSNFVRTDMGLVGDRSYSGNPDDSHNIGGLFTIGNTFGEDKEWGILFNASYWNRAYQSDLVSTGGGWIDDEGFFLPPEFALYDYSLFRERIGVNANLEYRPDEDNQYYFRYIFNQFTDDEGRPQVNLDFQRGDLIAGSNATTGGFDEGRASREFRSRKLISTIKNISVGGENRFGDWTVDYMLTSAFASEETPRRIDWEFRSGGGAFPNTYDLSNYLPVIDGGAAIRDAGNFPFRRVRYRTEISEEDNYAGSLNVQRDMELFGHPGFLKFGVKRLTRDKFLDENRVNIDGDEDWDMSLVAVNGPEGFYDGKYEFGPVIDVDAAEALRKSNPEYFEADLEGDYEDNAAADYDISEDVTAVYGMAQADIGKLRITGGVRVEFTDNSYTANDLTFDVDEDIAGNEWGILVTKITGGKSYENVLPSINFRYTANENLQWRFSYTESISRPHYADLAPRQETEREEIGDELYGSISRGNPALKPFESSNFDISVDYYMGETNVISGGVFYKELRNPIYGDSGRFTNVTIDGFTYTEVGISQSVNAGDGNITGLELSYQTRFEKLPPPFDGLGISANATFIDSEVTVEGPTDFGVGPDVVDNPFTVPFFKQSDFLYNLAFWYQKHGIQARLAWNHKSGYLAELGSNSPDRTQDLNFDDRTQVDFKASYTFAEDWTVFVEVLNITDEATEQYAGIQDHFYEREFYKTSYNFGIRWSL